MASRIIETESDKIYKRQIIKVPPSLKKIVIHVTHVH